MNNSGENCIWTFLLARRKNQGKFRKAFLKFDVDVCDARVSLRFLVEEFTTFLCAGFQRMSIQIFRGYSQELFEQCWQKISRSWLLGETFGRWNSSWYSNFPRQKGWEHLLQPIKFISSSFSLLLHSPSTTQSDKVSYGSFHAHFQLHSNRYTNSRNSRSIAFYVFCYAELNRILKSSEWVAGLKV
jgi:hypothetical protein